jgi:RNA polymerase sigma factor (sigma-70 family)
MATRRDAEGGAVMNEPVDEQFYQQLRQQLIGYLRNRGWAWPDAEDVAQLALTEVYARRDGVADQRAYAFTIARRARPPRELPMGLSWFAGRPEPATTDTYRDGVLGESLAALPERLRTVVSMTIDGHTNLHIADELGIAPATVRSHKQRAKKTLRLWWADDGDELRRLSMGQRVYEAFLSGAKELPMTPRPAIMEAWNKAKEIALDPQRGNPVGLLDSNELEFRREQSVLNTDCGSWVLSTLDTLARDAGQMMAVADVTGVVLWRSGNPSVLEKTAQAGFTEAATWTFEAAGPGGIALALTSKKLVAVQRFEHFVQNQHPLSCIAIYVPDPFRPHRSVVLNLTGTQVSIHRAVARRLAAIAQQLRRELATRRPA